MDDERTVVFACAGDELVGVLHEGSAGARTGVVIVVGGPQYRVGSHRQFLQLARHLAAAGMPVLRFDTRGMGDSGGAFPGFEALDADIRAAVDALCAEKPALERVALWGLCDAASAILFYAHGDPRIGGIALVNPWIRTAATHARAQVRHYYLARLLDGAFWRRLVTGKVDIRQAVGGAAAAVRNALTRPASGPGGPAPAGGAASADLPLPERMAQGFRLFDGPVLLIMSGDDLTAQEFDDVARAGPSWSGQLEAGRVTRHDLPDADHTFSRAAWSQTVAETTRTWLDTLTEARRAP